MVSLINYKVLTFLILGLSFVIFNAPLNSSPDKKDKEKKTKANGELIFNSDKVHEIRIYMTQCNYLDSLFYYKKHYDIAGEANYMNCNVTIDNVNYYSVGIRMKGESSFENYPGNKKSLKLKFDKFIKKQSANGLDVLNLINGFKDPSMMREKIFLDYLKENGIPAPRCTYADVYLNNEHLGLYFITEQIDKIFLKNHFGSNKGSLYKGEPFATFEDKSSEEKYFKRNYIKQIGDTSNYSDLLSLTQTINTKYISQAEQKNAIDKSLNTTSLLKVWAITNLFNNIDAYNIIYPHNFYIYFNEITQKFEWIPYDANYAFCAWSPIFDLKTAENLSIFYVNESFHSKKPLQNVLFSNNDYKKEYIEIVTNLLKTSFTETYIKHKTDSLALKIRKYVYNDSAKMYSNQDFETNIKSNIGNINDAGNFIPGLNSFIKSRIIAVNNELRILK